MALRRRPGHRFAFASHAVHHHRLRRRPVLEVLEGRIVLATFTVNSLGDAGSGSNGSGDLRYCINQANASDQANSIVFDSTVFSTPQTIALSGGQLELEDTGGTQTITGPAAGVTISGGGASRVFQVDNGVTASLSGLTISGGSTSGSGGGVFNYGSALLSDCTLSGNSAADGGGGLDNTGRATLTDCTISGNSAGTGGGVFNHDAATLTDCTLSGNSAGKGGGLYNFDTATLTDTIVAGNTNPSGASDITTIGGPNHVLGSNNLIGPGGSGGLVPGVNGNIVLTSLTGLGLAPLGNYGGPTQTMALLPGSLALGAGSVVLGVGTDQRGFALDSPKPDIGAFQSQPKLVVNTTSDSSYGISSPPGELSLRQAVGLADFLGGPQTITFDPNVFATAQTMALTSGQLELSDTSGAVTITGPAAGVTISGGGNSRVFQIDSGVSAALSGLTIIGGSTSGYGGGLENLGTATLTGCTISGNSASDGGGVDNQGTATLTGCALSGNSASSGGGGVDNQDAATLAGCTLSGNSAGGGGGVDNQGTATLTDCTLSGNSATSGGGYHVNSGGGGVENAGMATLTDCTVSGNSAAPTGGGGLENDGTAYLTGTDCTIGGNSANHGGGVYNHGTATLTNCTVSGNSASGGGGLLNGYGTATLTECTVSGNSAYDAGGMYIRGTANLTACTVSGNSASGKYSSGGLFNEGTANLTDTIVAGNTDPSGASDIAGGNVSGSENLIGTGGSGGLVNGVDGNIVLTSLTDLGLAPLGDYGGPTQTIALLPGSPAIGAGIAASGVTADQRGFPLDSPNPDIGAFQTQPALVVNTTSDGIESLAGDLNLRQAVNLANVLTGAQSIRFDPNVFASPQTITLTGGQLELSNFGGTETIAGPAGGLTISGGGNSRVFQVESGVTAALSGLTITGGSTSAVGGGLYNQGTATLTDCTLSGNSAGFGGGLDNSSTATVTLTDCTISGNSAGFGGGLENAGTATLGTANLIDCTISGNSAVSGGGLENAGTATLTACTVTGNSASGDPTGPGGSVGGVYNHGKATLTDTIVAGNTNPSGASDIGGTRDVSGSANLIGTGGSGGLVNGVDGNIILTSLTDLGLAPLGNYGGPTQTIALLPGSPATGAGIAVNGVTADQRGFPLDSPNPDIGAFQTQPALVVNTTSDGIESLAGDLSLRQAVDLANVLTGAQSIRFDPSVFASPQTITLTGGQLELSNTGGAETIAGPAGGVTISGGGNSRVFQVDSGVTAALSGLTITDGSTPGNGGGLENLGTATITGCTISGNFAGSSGGGVDNLGTAMLTGCTISGNSAGLGGGLYSYGTAKLTLTDCTVSGNSASAGGGLYNYGTANLTMTDCTVSGNSAYLSGGGLENNRATVTLSDCSVSGNSAKYGGGVYNRGVFNNYGLANLTLTGCTISGNSANFGGGLDNYGMANLTLTDCTVSGNSALLNGGGVYNFANFYPCNLTLTGCTISGNYAGSGGGGVCNRNTATLTDTIVADNTYPSGASDIVGDSYVSGRYNLIGTGGSDGLVNGVAGNIILTSLTDLGLAPLGNYGGPTQTMALLPGSAASGAGVVADYPGTSTPITTDQRGEPLDTPKPDIGAFQSQASITLSFSVLGDQSITYGASTVTISGTLANGSQAPVGETVDVTLDGVEQSATIGSGGAFTTTFNDDPLTVANSPYTVSYAYAGDRTFAAASSTSSLTITPATLTITANPETKVYGTSDPALAYKVTGLEYSDSAATVLTGVLAQAEVGTLAGEQAGGYAITQGTLAADSNYTIAFTGSTLTINPAPLTVTANQETKIYGTVDPALTVTATGLVNTTVDGVRIDDPAATALIGVLARAQAGSLGGEQVGAYAITQGTLAASSNYTIDFTGSTLSINPAILTVSANQQTKVYGSADPSLTYTATGLINTTADGVTIADTAGTVLTGDLVRATGETVSGGPYAITQGTLAANSNYTIRFTGSALFITPATLTIVADQETKVFGSADPTLAYTCSGFQFSETAATVLTGSLARAAGETVSGSPYAIGQGTLTASSNYAIHFTGSTLTITPATPTLNVNAPEEVYTGKSTAANVTVIGASGAATASLEGVSPTLTYYVGSGTSGKNLGTSAPSAAGTYTVVARFPGSADYAPAQSMPATFAIAPGAAKIALTSSVSTAVYGQTVTFVATVSSPADTPSGTVTFLDGTSPLATVVLNSSGQAALSDSSLAPGSQAIMATYNGNADFQGVSSSPTTESVRPAATAIVLVPHAVVKGKRTLKAVELTAEIEPVAPGRGVPTGTVTFEFVKRVRKTVKVKTLGTATVSGGEATLTFKSNAVLNETLTIIYSGDTDFLASSVSSPKLTKRALV